ncbi:hypothetical protein QVD17_29810 [Tagetes erecta]|uniref:HP domain-containing protein n=1 Tax=Tagetes erecta TaxID=13708 RepID=A0AAD8K488_TARER|nr:hypothetical protein QVD17_29810 [Tagetes erecta]
MSVSMKNVDPAFIGAGQKAYPLSIFHILGLGINLNFASSLTKPRGIEVWRIENSKPVAIPESSHGKFFTGDSYMILKTTASKTRSFRYDMHYWIGKDANEDEANIAAIKTLELDAYLGGRSVQYRELQGYETESKYKIFQFNGSNTSIQERAKALEVVQYIKDTYHHSKCDIASIDDGRLMADAEAGEFWAFFGGFAPLPRKTNVNDHAHTHAQSTDTLPTQLFCIIKGQAERVAADTLTKKLLETYSCYLLDCGSELYVWMGRSTSMDDRRSANKVAEEYLRGHDRTKTKIIRMIENFETVSFRSKFESWPQSDAIASQDGKGKVAALLKRQGLDVKGLIKNAPKEEEEEEEAQPNIDCSGTLQVWRVNGQGKSLLSDDDQAKFYTGDSYIFQYTYTGDGQEECLIGTWFGKESVKLSNANYQYLNIPIVSRVMTCPEDRDSALSQANKMVESVRFLATQGGLSSGYKNYISEKGLPDETYQEDGIALFRVQGSGPENMQSIQVDSVASSLNSSYCYILHKDSLIFTWKGSQTSIEDHELVERQLDVIKPDMQTRVHKERAESDEFWEILGGKKEYPSQKIHKETESDPHLFSCTSTKGEDLRLTEIYNFNQDDLMAEDIYILDCHTEIFLWVGQEVNSKDKTQALAIGDKYLERDVLLVGLFPYTPIYIIFEGSEPPFFTRFFKWNSAKSAMHGNSFQRKLSIIKDGGLSNMNLKRKKRAPVFGGRSMSEKPQRSRSVSFGSDRPRARGRSPAFNALASKFDNPIVRNLSTPPQLMMSKLSGGSGGSGGGGNLDTSKLLSKAKAIASLTASFDRPMRELLLPRSIKVSSDSTPKSEPNTRVNYPRSSRKYSPTIKEDPKENEVDDEKGLTFYPYHRLTTSSTEPAPDIDVTRREIYLSNTEFREKFNMTKEAFNKMPKWRQNKMKISLKLF